MSHLRYARGPFKGYWVAPQRRWRVRLWFDYACDRWDDRAYEKNWPEKYWLPEWGLLNKIFAMTCRVAGHLPTNDHCGRPDHRYCVICNSITPGAEVKAA